ncbi:MAG: hypothetical protein DIZ78_02255 [endosymbiont of Escarpia spicata]|uniref:Lipoprotein n=1 Tax=endosymbiont of Escarpia spicata TaxID=2200908 RepID=A0A370DSS5_9GAMM|nr:MAG: hypothetical protein DIZ78_02255 [endosymbiont of Escarpia spicata]
MKKTFNNHFFFRVIFFLLIMNLLTGCIALNRVNGRQVQQSMPTNLIGDWVFSIVYDHRGSLQITNKKIILSLTGDQGQGLVEAVYIGRNTQGHDKFRFKSGHFSNTHIPSRMWRDYQVANGFAIYLSNHKKRNRSKRYNIYLTQDGVPLRGLSGDIYPLREAKNTGRIIISASKARGYFLYKGPQINDISDDRFISTINVHKSSKLVNSMISRTVNGGYNCGNVINTVVRNGELKRIKLPPDFSGTLIKVVSPLGEGRLIFGLGSTTSSYGSINTIKDGFPTIHARNFTGKPFIDLFVLPERVGDFYKKIEIPVSLYYFNRRLLVDRNGCEFLKTSTFQKSFALGKLYFSILMEKNRRDGAIEGDKLKQYIGIYGRDTSLLSALRDVFPNVNESAISYMARNIGNVMQNGLDPDKIALANYREGLLQEFESQPGMNGQGLRYLDILLDLENHRTRIK